MPIYKVNNLKFLFDFMGLTTFDLSENVDRVNLYTIQVQRTFYI